MSVQAMTWVIEHAVGVDRDGDQVPVPSHLLPVLNGLANRADSAGCGAYPGQPELAWGARKSERAVRNDLAELLKLGVIRLGDQRLVDHIPADARPVVYDLAMERSRGPRPRGRNHSTSPQDPGAGSGLPPGPGQQVPPAHDRPEPDDRAESQFRPEPHDRPSTSGPEQMDRKPTSAPIARGRKWASGGGGSGLPGIRHGTVPSSSSSATDPQSLVDRYSRSVAIIRRHLDPAEVDDETAALLADWIFRRHGPRPALLGAYVRRMALAGDLAGAMAEMRAGDAHPPGPAAPSSSLIALGERAAAQRATQAPPNDSYRAARARAAAARRARRTAAEPGGGGPDPPATAAAAS